ncbi:hypothetical protein MYCTH_2130688 [Thermothelomyces thermophilus ATCC 42464]|uniref:Uncharacterized protein n=1 Tax=Thermothelomyces thermophilus (strain ATCC 42464 / BCRC 31852 / DSM 1799) TaxID=573729 RepID=G2QPL2_THET4|nr:uncharacterized protein MYCTH_2130688 [Thermothelomyces thermophilus ATCC 42464]AEO61525.1 hypothetical protein MYCTH_2130688 [Thermothelomyces thermophilus ATCC 42464]
MAPEKHLVFLSPQTRHSQHPNLEDTLASHFPISQASSLSSTRNNPRAAHASHSTRSSSSPRSVTMVRCNKCGKDETEYAVLVDTLVACTSQGCVRGYKKCNSCTYLNGYMVKCCASSDCAGTGKRECVSCSGTGTKIVKIACSGKHRKRTPPPGGYS